MNRILLKFTNLGGAEMDPLGSITIFVESIGSVRDDLLKENFFCSNRQKAANP